MEELLLVFALCLVGGSSYFLYYYPLVTTIAIIGILGGTYRWWRNKQAQITYQEEQSKRLDHVKKHPDLAQVYIPDFENTVDLQIKALRAELEKKEQNEVLEILDQMEEVFRENIIPRKQRLEQTLDDYVKTNHLVLEKELEVLREKLEKTLEESMKPVIENSIRNLEEKRSIMNQSKEELVYFYSQVKNLLQQIENMRLKTSRLSNSQKLLADLREDMGQTLTGFSDASNLLDEISKI